MAGEKVRAALDQGNPALAASLIRQANPGASDAAVQEALSQFTGSNLPASPQPAPQALDVAPSQRPGGPTGLRGVAADIGEMATSDRPWKRATGNVAQAASQIPYVGGLLSTVIQNPTGIQLGPESRAGAATALAAPGLGVAKTAAVGGGSNLVGDLASYQAGASDAPKGWRDVLNDVVAGAGAGAASAGATKLIGYATRKTNAGWDTLLGELRQVFSPEVRSAITPDLLKGDVRQTIQNRMSGYAQAMYDKITNAIGPTTRVEMQNIPADIKAGFVKTLDANGKTIYKPASDVSLGERAGTSRFITASDLMDTLLHLKTKPGQVMGPGMVPQPSWQAAKALEGELLNGKLALLTRGKSGAPDLVGEYNAMTTKYARDRMLLDSFDDALHGKGPQGLFLPGGELGQGQYPGLAKAYSNLFGQTQPSLGRAAGGVGEAIGGAGMAALGHPLIGLGMAGQGTRNAIRGVMGQTGRTTPNLPGPAPQPSAGGTGLRTLGAENLAEKINRAMGWRKSATPDTGGSFLDINTGGA